MINTENASDLTQELAAGSYLIITSGCHSDYAADGPVRMLVTATKQALVDEFRAQWTPEWAGEVVWQTQPDEDDFLPWLVRSGKAEAADCERWHIGDYGFDP